MMDSDQPKLLVRADAGPKVGTGHVMRTLALGQAWKRRGGNVTFVCGELPNGLVKRIEAEDFHCYKIKQDHCDALDANATTEIAFIVQPHWIVLDGYRFNDAYQQTFKKIDARLMVVDDYQHAAHRNADVILNQNLGALSGHYAGSSQARILTGPEYALLRSEFADFKHDLRNPRQIPNEAKRILVTFGGADPDNWTLKTLQVLSSLGRKNLVVDCVIGAFYKHLDELAKFKKTANLSLRLHRNVDRMSSLMDQVDIAISAGGSTCYELARCGVPSIVHSIADNQQSIVKSMSRNHVMISIDDEDEPSTLAQRESRLARSVRQLINNPERRREMSVGGMQLVDGRGANRIALQMAAFNYRFRAANRQDAETLWRWRNDPEVRSVSFDENLIPFERHQGWLDRRLQDPNTILWIWEKSSGEPVGQVRFELTEENPAIALISIIVDQSRRGRGLGTALIVAASDRLLESNIATRIVARIKPGNAPSEKAFRAAGFHAIEPVIANGKMAFQYALCHKTGTAKSPSTLKKSA